MRLGIWNIGDDRNYSDNISLKSYIYCSLYYFYYGKAYNGITRVTPSYDEYYHIVYYNLDQIYKIDNDDFEAVKLYKKYSNSLIIFDASSTIHRQVNLMHRDNTNKTINIKDIPECIKKFAIKYDKILYYGAD